MIYCILDTWLIGKQDLLTGVIFSSLKGNICPLLCTISLGIFPPDFSEVCMKTYRDFQVLGLTSNA